MSIALLETSCFFSNPVTSTLKPTNKKTLSKYAHAPFSSRCRCSCSSENDENSSSMKFDKEVAKLALVAVAAGLLTLGAVDPASAAKTGGRVGGQAFRSSAPRSSGPRINNSRTNVFINPPIAPPLVGGYGYGFGLPYYGWSPFSFFAPGPSVAIGVGGGFDLFLVFILLGAVSAFVRRFFGSRTQDDDDDE